MLTLHWAILFNQMSQVFTFHFSIHSTDVVIPSPSYIPIRLLPSPCCLLPRGWVAAETGDSAMFAGRAENQSPAAGHLIVGREACLRPVIGGRAADIVSADGCHGLFFFSWTGIKLSWNSCAVQSGIVHLMNKGNIHYQVKKFVSIIGVRYLLKKNLYFSNEKKKLFWCFFQ